MIDLSPLENLKKIGNNPFAACTKLFTIILSKKQIDNGVISNEDMKTLKINKKIIIKE